MDNLARNTQFPQAVTSGQLIRSGYMGPSNFYMLHGFHYQHTMMIPIYCYRCGVVVPTYAPATTARFTYPVVTGCAYEWLANNNRIFLHNPSTQYMPMPAASNVQTQPLFPRYTSWSADAESNGRREDPDWERISWQ